jgi:threonine synthase
VARDTSCVCVLTGNGLKDPDTAVSAGREPLHIAPSLTALAQALGWA